MDRLKRLETTSLILTIVGAIISVIAAIIGVRRTNAKIEQSVSKAIAKKM